MGKTENGFSLLPDMITCLCTPRRKAPSETGVVPSSSAPGSSWCSVPIGATTPASETTSDSREGKIRSSGSGSEENFRKFSSLPEPEDRILPSRLSDVVSEAGVVAPIGTEHQDDPGAELLGTTPVSEGAFLRGVHKHVIMSGRREKPFSVFPM